PGPLRGGGAPAGAAPGRRSRPDGRRAPVPRPARARHARPLRPRPPGRARRGRPRWADSPDRQRPARPRGTFSVRSLIVSTRPQTDAAGTPAPGKLSILELAELKRAGRPIVMVTAYDYPSGRL